MNPTVDSPYLAKNSMRTPSFLNSNLHFFESFSTLGTKKRIPRVWQHRFYFADDKLIKVTGTSFKYEWLAVFDEDAEKWSMASSDAAKVGL